VRATAQALLGLLQIDEPTLDQHVGSRLVAEFILKGIHRKF
jgi:hypothetical protein